MSAPAAQIRVQEALELLGRASQDWRNGTAEVPGALHWPVAVNLARRQLREALEALEALEAEGSPAEALIGMSWWNSLPQTRRRYWLDVAGSARPADAWRAFQDGVPGP